MQSELVDTVDSLVESLQRHQVLAAAQLAELTARSPGHCNDARTLARDLIQRGWLTPFQVNQLLTGRGATLRFGPYLLLERIGEGATGQVFKARHMRMQRDVALKILRPELLTDPEVVQRFYREVQVISHLSHPHIVHAYDAGHIGRMHYLVMEHVDGADLAQLVKRSGLLPVAQACAYLFQAALGLQHAHEKGLVHRDIKPSNLIVTQKRSASSMDLSLDGWGQVKLLDLGLARVPRSCHDDLNSMVTVNGKGMMGTPDFLAPEQALDFHTADIRSDLYSLGCTAYFLLAGEAPFAGCTLAQKLLRHQQCPPPPLTARRPDLPAALLPIVDRLLAKTPEERYQTPAALADALAPIVGAAPPVPLAEPVPRSVVEERAWKSDVDDTTLLPPHQNPLMLLPPATDSAVRGRAARRRWLLFNAIGAIVLLALLGLFLSLLSRHRGDTDSGASTATTAEDSLTVLLNQFEARQQRWASGGTEDAEQLRHDLLRFQREYAGTPQALQSLQVLKDLPSPFDRLSETAIPADQRRRWHPRDLVAVLGEQRGRAWSDMTCVAVSPDGKHIAGGCPDGTISLFDAETLVDDGQLKGRHGAAISSVAFSPDSRSLVTCAFDYTAQIWAIKGPSRFTVYGLKHPAAYVYNAVFAPSGKQLAVCCADGLVHIWQLQEDGNWNEQPALPMFKGSEPVHRLAFSSDGKLLAGGTGDGLIRLWDVADAGFVERKPLKGHTAGITSLAFYPGERLLFSGSFDRSVRLWDIDQPEQSAVVHVDPSYRPTSIAVSPDGKLLSFTHYALRPIHLWDVADPHHPRQLASLRGNAGHTSAVAFALQGKTLVSVGEDRQVRLWDTAAAMPQERLILPGTEVGLGGITSVAVSDDGASLALHGRYDGFSQVWNLGDTQPRERYRVRGYGGLDPGMVFAPDGKTLYHSHYQTVLVTPLTGDKPSSTELKPPHTARVAAIGLSPDGRTLATAGTADQTIRLWDVSRPVTKEKAALLLKDPNALPKSLSFTPDGKTLGVLASDHKLYLWNLSVAPPVERGQPLSVSELPQAFDFSPDGKTLGVLGTKELTATVVDWTTPKTQVGKVLGGQNGAPGGLAVFTLSFAPDGRTVAIAGHGSDTVQVHDLANRKKPRTWSLPGPVMSVAFSGDGRHLLSGNGNGTVFVLRLAPAAAPTRQ
jgi:WD40 repeat protein/serine/threonine protein kinase